MEEEEKRMKDKNVTHSFDGFIGIFDNVLSDNYITEIIKYFEKLDQTGFIQSTRQYSAAHERDLDEIQLVNHDIIHRVNGVFLQDFFKMVWEIVWPLYTNKFSILKNERMEADGLKMKRIKPGGGFHAWHYESGKDQPSRKVVVQMYLNDIDEAGETEFLYQNKRFSPKKNRVIVWPADWFHTHRGNPPIGKTDKYILTTWIQESLQV
tara:strand:- start:853 stop:1476 length:624 start_codon:yes stop_codon:yes gene_type:complete